MPAGSPEVLEAVIRFGADAVYVGAETLSLRAKAHNFSEEELQAAIRLCHRQGKRLYLAVNIFAHNRDLKEARELFEKIRAWTDKPDAFIVSDFGIFRMAQSLCPDVSIHISTQTNSTNYETFRFWYSLGAKRVVCARELSLEEIREIYDNIPREMEIEAFVHGAMCMSYSGRCLISNFLAGRDANQGLCTHPCRWKYFLTEETRPGQYLPLEEDGRGTYLYNSKDLCMIGHLPELLEAGVKSLKVEGRMKTLLYAVTVARAYRLALDALARSREEYERILPLVSAEVSKCTTREYCTGFYFGRPGPEAQNMASSEYRSEYRYMGMLREDEGGLYVEQKNKFRVGDVLEAIRPDGTTLPFTVDGLKDAEGSRRPDAPHPGEKLYVISDAPLRAGDLLRKENCEKDAISAKL